MRRRRKKAFSRIAPRRSPAARVRSTVMASKRDKQRKQERRQREARRGMTPVPAEEPDDRATFAQVQETVEGLARAGDFLVVIEPIRRASGDAVWFQSPHVVPFYLLTAKRLRDEGEPQRLAALTNTVRLPDQTLRPREPAASFDALEGLHWRSSCRLARSRRMPMMRSDACPKTPWLRFRCGLAERRWL
jgi:hypothetical protein